MLVTDVIDHVTLNGVLHQVKKPIIIPNEDLLSWLKRRGDLTILSNGELIYSSCYCYCFLFLFFFVLVPVIVIVLAFVVYSCF